MSVPDLLGTQGTFLLFTTRPPAARFKEGGHAGADRSVARRSHRHGGHRPGERLRRRPPAAHLSAHARARPRRRCAPPSRWAGRASRSPIGELSDWLTLPFPRRARRHRVGHRARAGARDGRARLALHVADQPRPRGAGDADLASRLLRRLPGQAPRAVRHARARRGHLGAQRRRDRRRHLPEAGARHRRRAAAHVPDLARASCARARSSACSTAPTASSTCSGATSTRSTRPTAPTRRPSTATPSRRSTRRTTRWSARSWRRSARAIC